MFCNIFYFLRKHFYLSILRLLFSDSMLLLEGSQGLNFLKTFSQELCKNISVSKFLLDRVESLNVCLCIFSSTLKV